MESFWHSRKVEETHEQDVATRAEAKHSVFGYILIYRGLVRPEGSPLGDNATRMHSSLGYQLLNQIERKCNAKSAEAANDYLSTVSRNDSQFARLNKRAA